MTFFVSETRKQWVMISLCVYSQFLSGLLLISIGVVINVLIIRHGNSCECMLFTIVFSDVTRLSGTLTTMKAYNMLTSEL